MSAEAPVEPSTKELHKGFPLNDLAEIEIPLGRERISEILTGDYRGLVAIVGPCSETANPNVIQDEGNLYADLTKAIQGLYVSHRLPPWKPRTNPDDWHGLETTEPQLAYAQLNKQAEKGVSIEFGKEYHIARYGQLCVFGWIGGRNVKNTELMEHVATELPDMPLGIKNGLDGELEPALSHVNSLQKLRGPDDAPVVLIYRGGSNAQNPEAWRDLYIRALDLTKGKMIVDTAHGAEMAHDPNGEFKKSIEGQELALMAIISLTEEGYAPAGIMMEASQAESPTDPVMSVDVAVDGIKRLHAIKMTKSIETTV